jgi:fucose 4-O-acetylase-like acetyltransferase
MHAVEAVLYAPLALLVMALTFGLAWAGKVPFKAAERRVEWLVIALLLALVAGVTLYYDWTVK